MHHADPLEVYQPNRVGMILNTALARYSPALESSIMTTKGTLKHVAATKGLNTGPAANQGQDGIFVFCANLIL